jgi:hypothetical protein
VVLRTSTSTSPDCSAVNRSFAVSATNLIFEDRRRERAAEVDVETGPVALRVRQAEARDAAVGAAIEHAARLDGIERLGRGRRGGNSDRRREGELGYGAFHGSVFSGLEVINVVLGQLLREPAGCRRCAGFARLQGVSHRTNSHTAPEWRI